MGCLSSKNVHQKAQKKTHEPLLSINVNENRKMFEAEQIRLKNDLVEAKKMELALEKMGQQSNPIYAEIKKNIGIMKTQIKQFETINNFMSDLKVFDNTRPNYMALS